MKTFILGLSLLFSTQAFATSDSGFSGNYLSLIPSSLPTVCRLGDVRVDSGTSTLKMCDGSSTWGAIGGGSILTTLGDMLYENATPADTRLVGNTTTTKKYLTQTGTGSVSAAPSWATILAADVPTLNQNTSGTAANITATSNSTLLSLPNVGINGSQIIGNIPGNAANVSTGVVAVANGGTNNGSLGVTAGSMFYADGSKIVSMGAGSAGQVPVSAGTGAPTWGTPVGGNFANLITNGDFSNGTTGWTASGGTLNTVTTGTDFMGVGKTNATWDASAAGQTLTSTAYTIAGGYGGTNGLWRCKIQNLSGATYTLGRWDGTTLTDAITIDPGTVSKYVEIADSFGSTGGTTAIRLTAVASNEPLISIADCYFGLNFNLSSVLTLTNNVSAGAITIGGTTTAPAFGTTTTNNVSYHFEGQYAVVTYTLVQTAASANGGSGDYLLSLPNNLQADTTIIPAYTGSVGSNLQQVAAAMPSRIESSGVIQQAASSAASMNTYPAFLYSATQFRVSGLSDSSGGIGAGTFGSSNFVLTTASLSFSFTIKVPIAGRTASNVVRADTTPGSWAGYHDGNCTWSTTLTTLSDPPSGDATCTFAQLSNTNFGTVTSYLISGNAGPGIVFTPRVSGNYFACVDVSTLANSAQGGGAAIRLVDGSGNELGGTSMEMPSFGGDSTHVCGILNSAVQGVSTTVKLFLASGGANTATINLSGAIAGSRALEWQIFPISQNLPNPMLVGTVLSSSPTQERTERAKWTSICSSSPCTLASNTPAIASVTRSSTGVYVVNFVAGTWSLPPTCTATSDGLTFDGAAATTITFQFGNLNGAIAAADATRMNIICMGPR